MKKLTLSYLFIIFLISITSCGFHNGLTKNYNAHNTEVQLNRKNFKVIKTLSASSTATYILGIGGIDKRALIANARAEMIKNAEMEGAAKAIINETVEIHVSNLIVIAKYTVTVSGTVIEFTE